MDIIAVLLIASFIFSSWIIISFIKKLANNYEKRRGEEKLEEQWRELEKAILDLGTEIKRSAVENELEWPPHPVIGNINELDVIQIILHHNYFSCKENDYLKRDYPSETTERVVWLKDAERFLSAQRRTIYAEGIDQEFLNKAGDIWRKVDYAPTGEPNLSSGVETIFLALNT